FPITAKADVWGPEGANKSKDNRIAVQVPAGSPASFRIDFNSKHENEVLIVGLRGDGTKLMRWGEAHNYDKQGKPIPNNQSETVFLPASKSPRTYWIVGLHKDSAPKSSKKWRTTDDHVTVFD